MVRQDYLPAKKLAASKLASATRATSPNRNAKSSACRAEMRRIPESFDYRKISGLSREVTEKLTKVRPQSLGQAQRIPGVTPAAVSLVNIYIEIFQRRSAQQST